MTRNLTRLAAALGLALGALVWTAAAAGATDSDCADWHGPDRNGPDSNCSTDSGHTDDVDDGVIRMFTFEPGLI
jgi:hypothetical protein